MSAFIEKLNDYKNQGKVYVMADLGSNYKSKKDLMDAIWLAKALKIDAIKYQWFSSNELYGPRPHLNDKFPIQDLATEAKVKDIDLMCTAFSPEGYEALDPLVNAHKVASSEMSHIRILEKLKSLNKPVVLSCGAQSIPDVQRVLNFMQGTGVVLMHANSKYPAKYSDLEKFGHLKAVAPGHMGYSDHTTSIDVVPLYFKNDGVTVYEKHWNPFQYTDTPDAVQSLNNDEFKAMTQILHGEKPTHTEENEARLCFIRRVVATQDIGPGDVLREGVNMGIFRSKTPDAKGLNPFMIGLLEGKSPTKQVKQFEGLSLSDVQ